MTGDEIRATFLRFFEEKGHTVLPSSSLIPQGDPTLLLTTAGMVQIKPYFLGLETPPNTRLASCQKCFRTTDVEAVGDAKHLTFFEMLGNFSVGDYFKKETINWAWEFVLQRLKLSREKLWITIFLDDEEANQCWLNEGVPADRIVRLGEKDNFWGPAGDSGPCGPCSEIHYDFGPEAGCGKENCGPDCDCGRFSEIWNLVFTQYDQDRDGHRTLLPKPNIDTGMGLERVATVMQGYKSVYETDLFAPIVAKVLEISGKEEGDSGADRAVKIVAEHSRGITFLIADGVVPGNDGRGYVLRRLLRRTSLFGRRLGLEGQFINELTEVVTAKMEHAYPELRANRELVRGIVDLEEKRFGQALDSGLNWLDRVMERAEGEKRISGEDAFMLYDTYGFPKELTVEVASERGFAVDTEGFEREMERQRERARASHKFSGNEGGGTDAYERLGVLRTDFVGYDQLKRRTTVLGLLVQGQPADSASEGDELEVVLQETPFYGEMGGQVGDSGTLHGEHGTVEVTKAIRPLPEMIVHRGRVTKGRIAAKEGVEAEVDATRRLDIARNHTATHLLQYALRKVLGQHVRQSGSLVAPERFRFDFTHFEPVSRTQLSNIQHAVNEKIRDDLPVVSRTVPYKEALAGEAIALFGEKYGDVVRVVEVGNPPISKELCGGTHVHSTGEIGFLQILTEGSVGSGLRRIEAVTGRGAESLVEQRFSSLEAMAQELQTSPDAVGDKVVALRAELEKERKRAAAFERELARNRADSLLSQVQSVWGVNVLAAKVTATTPEAMREMGDRIKEELGSGIIVLGALFSGKPNFVAMVTPDLVAKGLHAGELLKQVARIAGGGGGGRAEIGQGSGKDAGKLEEALGHTAHLVETGYDRGSDSWKKKTN